MGSEQAQSAGGPIKSEVELLRDRIAQRDAELLEWAQRYDDAVQPLQRRCSELADALVASAAKVKEGGRNMDHARGYDAGYEAGGHDMIRKMWAGPCIKQNAFGAEPCLESDPDPCIVCRLGAERDALTAKLQAVTKHIENHYCAVSTQWCSKHAIYHGDSCAVIASPEARATGDHATS